MSIGFQESIFTGLNEAQTEAVRVAEGPVLVIAGPGTGKTLTIVRRIAYLIRQGVDPGHVAAVTFTNRAAREMRVRADELLGKHAGGVFIGTLHLLGFKILRENLPGTLAICSREDQIELLKTLSAASGIKAQEAADRISRIKSMMEDRSEDIEEIYNGYQSLLAEKGAVDFDDLIVKPLELFTDSSPLLGKYKSKFRHIIVDEYQDINQAQYRLLRLLAGQGGNICAVGDSDQAIYAFRGADVENFLNFEKDFDNAKSVCLTHNYRSSATILSASDTMIRNNAKRVQRALHPTKAVGDRIAVVSAPDERAEGEVIVNEIEARIGGTSHYRLMNSKFDRDFSDDSYGFSDFAVMFRTNAQAAAIEAAFMESGIPYQVIGKKRAEKGEDTEDILSMLKACGIEAEPDELLSLMTPSDTYDPRADAVTLMTLHMAKGLEFKVAFITGVEDGLIPYTITKGSVDVEEERRLFYVGMTRAKEDLFLIHARKRFLYGRELAQAPSPFLSEIPEEYVHRRIVPDKAKPKADNQMKLF